MFVISVSLFNILTVLCFNLFYFYIEHLQSVQTL